MLAHRIRTVAPLLALGLIVCSLAAPAAARAASAQVTTGKPRGNSHWDWCNGNAVHYAPAVFWTRINEATGAHHDLPAKFWTNTTYRDDIAKIVCYESTFNYHAEAPGQYGWFQMSGSLIASEGVTFDEYWGGSKTEHPGWYQCTAGERYILSRYKTPVAAWAHEADYGWY